jgi:hypothetical protein
MTSESSSWTGVFVHVESREMQDIPLREKDPVA